MALADIIKTTLVGNREKVVKNSFEEKASKLNTPVEPIKLFQDNKKFNLIVAKYNKMAEKEYWKTAIDEFNKQLENVERKSDSYFKLCKAFELKWEKAEIAYNTYGDIMQNPLIMDEKLKWLSSEIKKIDEEIGAIGVEQINLFGEGRKTNE